jgi:hypothetical protein
VAMNGVRPIAKNGEPQRDAAAVGRAGREYRANAKSWRDSQLRSAHRVKKENSQFVEPTIGSLKPPAAATKTITLPSGKTAVIREAFGQDLKRAQRAVADDPDESAVMFSLIAEIVEIDGEKIMYEDVLAMKLRDVLMLQREVIGGNFASPPPPPSPDSSN